MVSSWRLSLFLGKENLLQLSRLERRVATIYDLTGIPAVR
jgi:hypothetical protein